MKISNTLWIILALSVALGVIIMIASFIITHFKINKIKKKVKLSTQDIKITNNKALDRKNAGELLWDLKAISKNPLQDEQLEFLINTAFRNNYKTFRIINSFSSYESENFKKIAKLKDDSTMPDLTIIFSCLNLQEQFEIIYKSIQTSQMIAIVNAPLKNKNVKQFLNYLKSIKAKYNIIPIGKGIILVVK